MPTGGPQAPVSRRGLGVVTDGCGEHLRGERNRRGTGAVAGRSHEEVRLRRVGGERAQLGHELVLADDLSPRVGSDVRSCVRHRPDSETSSGSRSTSADHTATVTSSSEREPSITIQRSGSTAA